MKFLSRCTLAVSILLSTVGVACATPTGGCGSGVRSPTANSYNATAADEGYAFDPTNATGPAQGWASVSLPVTLPVPSTVSTNFTICGFTNDNKALIFNAPLLAAPSAPALSSNSGGTLTARTEYYKITYTNATGETVPSTETSIALGANTLAVVTSPGASGNATGYNVYAASSTGAETLQNATPIAIGTNWTEPTGGLVSGAALPSTGTAAAAYILAGGQRLLTLITGPGDFQWATLTLDGTVNGTNNYRVVTASPATLYTNGMAPLATPYNWIQLPSSGYAASQGDNGNIFSTGTLGSNGVITLPSTTAIRPGWSIGIVDDNNNAITVNTNSTAGGNLIFQNGTTANTYTIAQKYGGAAIRFDGANFRVTIGGADPSARRIIVASTNYYAGGTGASDSNDGQSATVANGHGPVESFDQLINIIQNHTDPQGKTVTGVLAAGTYNRTTTSQFGGVGVLGSGLEPQIEGAGSDVTTIVAASNGQALFDKDLFWQTINGLSLSCGTGGTADILTAQAGGLDIGTDVKLLPCPGGSLIQINQGGTVNLLASPTIAAPVSGDVAAVLINTMNGGIFNGQNFAIHVPAAVTVSGYAVASTYYGQVINTVFDNGSGGAATINGTKYTTFPGGMIESSGSDPNLSLNITGTTTNGVPYLSCGTDSAVPCWAPSPLILPTPGSGLAEGVIINYGSMNLLSQGLAIGYGGTYDGTTMNGAYIQADHPGAGSIPYVLVQPKGGTVVLHNNNFIGPAGLAVVDHLATNVNFGWFNNSGAATLGCWNDAGSANCPVAGQASSFTYTTPGITAPTLGYSLTGGLLGIQTYTPPTSSTSCTTGTITADPSYLYFCTGTNTWKRSALATF